MNEDEPTPHQAALDVGAPAAPDTSWVKGGPRRAASERAGDVLARIFQRQNDDEASGYAMALRDVEEFVQRQLRQLSSEDTEGRKLLMDVLEKVRELRGL